MIRRHRSIRSIWLAPLFALALLLAGASSALASRPGWGLEALSEPTVFDQADNASGIDQYVITLTNRGAAPTDGSPVTIVDHLPPGFTVNPAGAFGLGVFGDAAYASTEEVTCGTSLPVTCTYAGVLRPESFVTIFIGVTVPSNSPSSVTNTVSVSGGGALATSISGQARVGSGLPSFGLQRFDAWATSEDGLPVTQAGSHPYAVSTSFNLNTVHGEGFEWISAGGDAKDVRVDLPPGIVGDPNAVPQCTQQQFHTRTDKEPDEVECPDDSAVGVVRLLFEGEGGTYYPVYNLVPSPGVAASFGFSVLGVPVVLNASVRTGGDYGVQIDVPNITQYLPLTGNFFTFWGVPGDPSHDALRGHCANEARSAGCPSGLPFPLKPFLTLPTSCLGPQTTTASVDPWESPGSWSSLQSVSHDNNGNPLGLDGCGRVDFTPQISVAPDGTAASTPSGLTVDVHVPQERLLVATSLAESNVKDTIVTLPVGVALNPAAADGLQSCSTDQVGFQGQEAGSGTLLFSNAEVTCPDASKVGTVEIETPLLPNKLVGAAYLATQDENPFGSLVALYLIAKDPVSGVLVKLAGQVSPDPVTGQLVSIFENTPQLPFSDLRLNFFGTARAPLSTPALCGTYTTSASIAPWSSSDEPATPTSSFQINSGPSGTGCSETLPFAPSLTTGSTNLQAGAFTPFTLTMSREDGNQNLKAIQLRMPPGLVGTLSSVKLCGEPQADQGACGPESLIGHTIVSVGLGGDPYSVTGGQVFITGPYEGAPYGLSIVNPANAGPFHLGNVIVRARVEVDPHTAALTITTDDSGPYAIPRILDGIPLQIKHINVSIDREKFTFNPTNCDKQQITGSLSSDEGSSSALAVPFQVTNCATLAFKPKLAATSTGKTSRANGASLHVKLTYPAGPYDANIAKVKVDLPKQLPSRLTTLQKACLAATFEANPASCPAASIVGHAKATTPVLPVPLEGPAYFVSHAGEEFPSLIIVLQGYGTTVDLVGTTFISKAGVTSSTFKSVPDVPVGTFELTLPQGKYSALAANKNLCASKLAMPTAFVGQNGAEIHLSTPIAVTGCPKHKKPKRKSRKHPTKKGAKKKG
jgi:hypothetical protein